MAQTASNVSASKPAINGAVYVSPISSTLSLPTSAVSTLPSTFVSQGYISADGLTNALGMESNATKAWGGDEVMSSTSRSDRYTYRLIEALNTEVLKAAHGSGNVTGALATGITVKHNNTQAADMAYVIDMVMRGGVLKRIVIPSAQIENVADIVYNDNDPIGYEVTLAAHPDSAGNTAYEYIQTPTTSGSGGSGGSGGES